MAVPAIPIEIWAADDYTLPNAHTANKIRPINDIWAKGYDKGQRPDVQAWNYVFNMQTAWVKYLSEEQIPGLDSRFLKKDLNLSDVPDKAQARSNLGVYSAVQTDGKYVAKSGDVMTGALTSPRFNLVASATDVAYITTTSPATDVTYLDMVVGDNAGTAGQFSTDSIRFRFENATTGTFTMFELNAINSNAALGIMSGNFLVYGSVTATSAVINGTTDTSSLSVSGNSAIVAGKNIVRSVNGLGADGNGNVTLPFPPQGVQEIRQSGELQITNGEFTYYLEGRAAHTPVGAFMTGIADVKTDKVWIEDVDVVFYRYLQKYINGVWYNIGT